MGYRLLANLTMLVHFTFLAFVVFGGFLAWIWPRVIRAHLLVAAWGVSTIAFSIRCPLTEVENWARAHAGEAPLSGTGFIDHYIEGVLYPGQYARPMQAAAALVVLCSWLGWVMRDELKIRLLTLTSLGTGRLLMHDEFPPSGSKRVRADAQVSLADQLHHRRRQGTPQRRGNRSARRYYCDG